MKTGTSDLVDTYTITYTNGSTSTFEVTDGRGIVSILKTSTQGLVDTYTITYNDSTTSTYTVTNGEGAQEVKELVERLLTQCNRKLLSGESVDITDGADLPLADLGVKGHSVQDGTPTPESEVPINSVGDNVNLYDPSTRTEKYRLGPDGELIVNNSYAVSDFIEVEANSSYTYSRNGNSGNNASVYFYDSQKEYISRVVWSGTSITTLRVIDIETPPNTAYLRFCDLRVLTKIKLQKGTIESPLYSPYGMGCISIEKSNMSESKTYGIDTQEPMRSVEDTRDDFVNIDNTWYERHFIGHIASYNGETITTSYMSTTGELSTGAEVIYILAEPTLTECTTEQTQQLEELINDGTYKGVTHYYSEDFVKAVLDITYYQDAEVQREKVDYLSLMVEKAYNAYPYDNAHAEIAQTIYSAEMPLKGLRIEGNSRQNGVPEPTAKIDYLSSGESGNISIIKANENLATTNIELGSINIYKTYNISTQQPMRSIGNIRDCFEKVNGVWYEKHKIGHVLLNGSQTWVLYSGAFYADVTLNYLKQSGTTCACDQYLGVDNVVGGSAAYNRGNNTISLYSLETYNRIYLRDDRFSAPADLAAWFTQNNAHFYYIMNEETVLPCTAEQTAQLEEIINDGTYENTTYYWGTDTVSPVFDVTYYQQILPLAENHCDEYIDQQITQAIGGAY